MSKKCTNFPAQLKQPHENRQSVVVKLYYCIGCLVDSNVKKPQKFKVEMDKPRKRKHGDEYVSRKGGGVLIYNEATNIGECIHGVRPTRCPQCNGVGTFCILHRNEMIQCNACTPGFVNKVAKGCWKRCPNHRKQIALCNECKVLASASVEKFRQLQNEPPKDREIPTALLFCSGHMKWVKRCPNCTRASRGKVGNHRCIDCKKTCNACNKCAFTFP